ncbi:salicylate hydroxylase [Cladophialophora yegresii CBS 114405]|uniref:Salicylate hydroxylase n=1 Tax=Cladophialophora yegresii CBS 114405 TaxID=1182544 RepID=W9X4Y8_9EURO|nr:salicylate hydroxylase [Cladophialophora yegresii CBS 114405]EXJ65519.1 salicylate hydroxylase [Cladophialophora yegresii CBS 114405]
MVFEGWRSLEVAVIGGGIGGLAAATSLRRAGHQVTIYEQAHYAGEVGASISCAANGTRWLEEWNVNISLGKTVVLQKLIRHDWKTGDVVAEYDLSDYKDQWGWVYNMFHRVNMHEMLMDAAIGQGEGPPARLRLDHKCRSIDHEHGIITFDNGVTAHHDMIVGADGIGSTVRRTLGIIPTRKQSTSTCYHCVIDSAEVKRLGLLDLTPNCAIEFWGGVGIEKIVYSPCRAGEINSFYCFFPTEKSDHAAEGWNRKASNDELLAPFPDLDPRLVALFKHARDIGPWRLFVHEPYTHWTAGRTCLLGDAAHPMLPDQSQGACQAIEDAAALGLIFSRQYTYTADVAAGLRLYEQIRKPRATKVQAASARARENINERIGFSSQGIGYKAAVASGKLTIDEMNLYDMQRHVASEAAPERRIEGDGRATYVLSVPAASSMPEIAARM